MPIFKEISPYDSLAYFYFRPKPEKPAIATINPPIRSQSALPVGAPVKKRDTSELAE